MCFRYHRLWFYHMRQDLYLYFYNLLPRCYWNLEINFTSWLMVNSNSVFSSCLVLYICISLLLTFVYVMSLIDCKLFWFLKDYIQYFGWLDHIIALLLFKCVALFLRSFCLFHSCKDVALTSGILDINKREF